MIIYNTNDWYVFPSAIDKKTCNKIRRLSKGKWEESSVDISENASEEERITGKKSDYKSNYKVRSFLWMQ